MTDLATEVQLNIPGIFAIRRCTGCGVGKALTIEFFYCCKANRVGFDTRCRDCRNKTRRAWRAANADRINVRRRELYALRKTKQSLPIPEPAEGDDPDHNATGGVLIPTMVAEQSGEPEAGEAVTAGASAVQSPALLAPGDPASVEGVSADAHRHAPPAFQPQANAGVRSIANEPEPRRTGTGRPKAVGSASASARGFETSGLNAERQANERSESVTGRDTSSAVRGVGLAKSWPPSVSDDFPDIPEFLRRRPKAAA